MTKQDNGADDAKARATHASRAHAIGVTAIVALFVLTIAWEWWLAPLRPGGSWLILKAAPLLIPIWGIVFREAKRRYTYQWSTMFIWAYFTEGAVRVISDLSLTSRYLAGAEVVLCVIFFVVAVIYVRNTDRTPHTAS
jgi:uncharacterized membrane protein